MLACLPSTIAIGPDLCTHKTILTFKGNYLRDYFFKHFAGNTSVSLRDAGSKASSEIILWKTLAIVKRKKSADDHAKSAEDLEAIFAIDYTQHADGYVTCDILVSTSLNCLLNANNKEGKKYWDAAWENVIRFEDLAELPHQSR